MSSTEVFQDKAGQWRFRVRAGNNEIIHASESYSSRAHAERGIEDFLKVSAEADVEDVNDPFGPPNEAA